MIRLKWIVLTLATVSLFQLFYNLAPPCGEDELQYHISLPAQWVRGQACWTVISNPNSFFPDLGEMIYAGVLYVTHSYKAVKFTVWLSGALLLFLLAFLCQFMGAGEIKTWHVLLLFATFPCFVSLNGTTSVDMMQMDVELIALIFLWEIPNWSELCAPAGLVAGVAMGFRPYACGWVAGAFVWLLCLKKPKEAMIFAALAALAASPWPIRNWLATGNPFYPRAFWPGAAYDPWFLHEEMTKSSNILHSIIRLPSVLGWENALWGIGLFPILAFPVGWLKCRRLGLLTFLMLLCTAMIPMTIINPKYFCAAFPLLAILTVQALGGLSYLVWLLAVPGICMSLYFGGKRIPLILGFQTEHQYLQKHYAWEGYEMMNFINNHIRGKVLYSTHYQPLQFYYPRGNLRPRSEGPWSCQYELVIKPEKISRPILFVVYETERSTLYLVGEPWAHSGQHTTRS